MSNSPIVLVGGPDSGKTNYLARLWKALQSGRGQVISPKAPIDIEYVEDALAHLLQGGFAPRSSKGIEGAEQNLSIPVVPHGKIQAEPVSLVVPDVTGELWSNAVETCEVPSVWLAQLSNAVGALLFVRIGSNQNIETLDWVTAATLIKGNADLAASGQDDTQSIPSGILLCELLRFLELGLTVRPEIQKPRVAVLVAAWDRLDSETANRGPMNYLSAEYPLFAGRLRDISILDVKVFGISIVGGDFIDEPFRQQFLRGNLNEFGYVVHENEGEVCEESDVTIPIAWILRGS